MGLRIDFGGNYNEAQQKRASMIYDKIKNVFGKFGLSDRDFFRLFQSNISTVYFSSANFERKAEKRNNGDYLIRNIFIRPELDSEFSSYLNNNGFILIGDVFINPKPERSFFMVNDFYLCDDVKYEKDYEVEVNTNITIKTKYDNLNLDVQNSILSFDFIESLPYITSKQKFDSFISKWEKYLEFEYELTKMNIDYKQIKKLSFDVIYEVKANETNRETFANDIVVEHDKYLYIDEKSQYLKGDENAFVVASMILEDEKGLKVFLNQSLSLVGNRNINKIEAIKEGKEIEEFPQIMLGEYLTQIKDKDNNEVKAFFYVPEAIDDNGEIGISAFKDHYKSIIEDSPVLASTASGDIALYNRGVIAIRNLKNGRVKNPFLAGLLVDPKSFESSVDLYNEENITFALEKLLNESQKAAILKALNSNSIFLIQGPPGTGKTQTITELVYQYNKMGKKVLLSSQTHIAIDNVIERLPKEMNILPIRLVKDKKRANNQYLPDKLLDNLYDSAYHKFSSKIETFNNYSKEIDKIKNEYSNNYALYENIKDRQRKCNEISKKISTIRVKLQSTNDALIEEEKKAKKSLEYQEFLKLYYQNELDFNSLNGDIEVNEYFDTLKELFEKLNLEEQESIDDYLLYLKRIAGNTRIQKLKELSNGVVSKSEEYIKLEKEIEEQKTSIETLEKMNNPAMAPAIEILKSQINKSLRKLKELDENNDTKVIDIKGVKFYFAKNVEEPSLAINKELDEINNVVMLYKTAINKLMTSKFISKLEKGYSNDNKLSLEEEVKKLEVNLAKEKEEYNTLFNPIKNQQERLTEYFNKFYIEKLNNNSLPESDDDKFRNIIEYITDEETKFNKEKEKYDLIKDICQDTVDLLEDRKNFIARQRIDFTQKLFTQNANVYGITCTSSATFKSDRNDYLKALNIGDVDVANQDFDVVIIDEVSKATPIEIMIPLLYGKNVVLVGDQRQLPPIFKYRDSMFKDMDSEQLSRLFKNSSLEGFKSQVESSLFEEIYNMLDNNKIMLDQQYRSHSQIMNCVNVFYSDKLKSGWGSAQDNKKQHYLNVNYKKADGREVPIFDKISATYWFNANKYADDQVAYEKAKDGQTSLYNELEGRMTLELLKLIDKGYADLKENDYPTYIKAVGDKEDVKPSVAVITMYGAQIGYIKSLIKNNKEYKFSNINLDISTVDNYQGKEKDIIIVNFVRNNKRGEAGEFIKKFNRINVAISRARNMLIMVGSKEFCSNLTINVPDMGSNNENLIHAYGNIYDRCKTRFYHAAGIFGLKLRNGGK